MVKCIVIDDEPLALKQIEGYIARVPYLEHVASCNNAIEAEQLLATQDVDVVFVDINMPDLNGLDFVKQLAAAPLIVFTTAYESYALEGFKVGAIDYLLKPFAFEDFKRAADKVHNQVKLLRQAAVSNVDAAGDIFIKADYRIVKVAISSIRYIEAMSEYLKIYTTEQPRAITVLMSMKKMEERLPGSAFMRVHRSYIINLRRIREITKNHIDIGDGTSIPIGDIYKDAFNAYVSSKFLTK